MYNCYIRSGLGEYRYLLDYHNNIDCPARISLSVMVCIKAVFDNVSVEGSVYYLHCLWGDGGDQRLVHFAVRIVVMQAPYEGSDAI